MRLISDIIPLPEQGGKMMVLAVRPNVWPLGVTHLSIHGHHSHYDGLLSTYGEFVYVVSGKISFRGRAYESGQIAYLPRRTPLEYQVHAPTLACSLWEEPFAHTFQGRLSQEQVEDLLEAVQFRAKHLLGLDVNLAHCFASLIWASEL